MWGLDASARSARTDNLSARTAHADRVVSSICPYCAVGCGQLLYVKDKKIIDIEGDPASPISNGCLCPKGAATFQLVAGSHRATEVLYRRPHGTECHPVGFRGVMKARERGATIIHVEPRFTRTSAVANIHVPIRAGSDIAFLGGIVNYILADDLSFKEYIVPYTNASAIINDEFRDTEDLDGLFSGWNQDGSKYQNQSWMYQDVDTELNLACASRYRPNTPTPPCSTLGACFKF